MQKPIALISLAASLLIAGCSMQPYADTSNAIVQMGALRGKAMGGEQPISGATVTLYNTTTAAYGTGGTQISTTTTGSDGQFTFGSLLGCTAGQQIYITVTGGNSGGGSTNSQILELTGVGQCSSTGTYGTLPPYIAINEVTTLASTYALSNFMSIDNSGPGGSPFVHISAPANNNNSSGTGTTSAAAGLPHAFQNIATLINYQYGTANSTVASPGPGGSVGNIPQAEINTLADIFYNCVNSNGSATTGTSTPTVTTVSTPGTVDAVTTLTANSLSDYGYGSFSVNYAGQGNVNIKVPSQTFTTMFGSGTTSLLTLLTDAEVTTFAASTAFTQTASNGAGINLFVRPTNYTVSGPYIDYSSSLLFSGSLVMTYGGTTPTTYTVNLPSPVNAAGLVAAINSTFSSASVTANLTATSPLTINLSGLPGASANKFALVTAPTVTGGLAGLTPSVSSNVLTLTGGNTASNYTIAVTNGLTENADSSSCGALFSNTQSASGVLPTNTLQAAINVVKTPGGTTSNLPANLFGLLTSNTPFTPSLTAAPLDWSLAINYPLPVLSTFGGANNWPHTVVLDANDNAYVLANNIYLNPTAAVIYAFTSSGYNTYVSQAPGTAPSVVANGRNMEVDNLGNLWVVTPKNLYQFSTASGAYVSPTITTCEAQQYGAAVDLHNNIWTIGSPTKTNICEMVAGSGVSTAINYNASTVNVAGNDVAVDAFQNIWFAGNGATGTTTYQVFVVPNVGSLASPSYNSTSATGNTGTGYSIAGLTTTTNSTGIPGGIAIDSSGNGWTGAVLNTNGNGGASIIDKITPTGGNTAAITAMPAAQTGTVDDASMSNPGKMEVDGSGTVWIADGSTNGLIGYNSASSAFVTPLVGIKGCIVSGTTCGGAIKSPDAPRIDSTGSMWTVNTGSTSYTVTQFIGAAAPTWPWTGEGKPGVMPQ